MAVFLANLLLWRDVGHGERVDVESVLCEVALSLLRRPIRFNR